MSEADRIRHIIKSLEGGVAAAFAKKIGVSLPTVSKMQNGKIGIRKHIEKILKAYPNVRREWLMTGEGYPGHISLNEVIEHYEERIRNNEDTIRYLTRKLEEIEGLQMGLQAKTQQR